MDNNVVDKEKLLRYLYVNSNELVSFNKSKNIIIIDLEKRSLQMETLRNILNEVINTMCDLQVKFSNISCRISSNEIKKFLK